MPSIVKQSPTRKPVSKGGVLDRIIPVNQVKDRGNSFVIYGKSATGKTTAWSSWPKPILAVISSGGDETKSIRKIEGVHVVDINEEAELAELVEYQKREEKYKTFVLDHASSYQGLIFKKVVGRDVPVQMEWGSASQQQWGEIGLGMKERLQSIISLHCETVIVCQEREFAVEEEVSEFIQPYVSMDLSPSVNKWLGPAVEYAIQSFIRLHKRTELIKKGTTTLEKEVQSIQYCARVGPHPVYYTKFRKPKEKVLPDIVVDPTYSKLMELVK